MCLNFFVTSVCFPKKKSPFSIVTLELPDHNLRTITHLIFCFEHAKYQDLSVPLGADSEHKCLWSTVYLCQLGQKYPSISYTWSFACIRVLVKFVYSARRVWIWTWNLGDKPLHIPVRHQHNHLPDQYTEYFMFRSNVPLTVHHAGVGCFPKVKRFKGDKGQY